MRDEEETVGRTDLFVVGRDYHLGDLLWLTTVLAEYRRQVKPERLVIAAPDRPITQILEHNPVVDAIIRDEGPSVAIRARESFGPDMVLHDLRAVPLGVAMVRRWRQRLPWLYYRDLWLEARGQWLATFLRLGRLRDFRPVLSLTEEDRVVARTLPPHYITLAPHVGHYSLPLAGAWWRRVKGWNTENWVELARTLRHQGYEPVTLAGSGQEPIPGTRPLIGLPVRQVAGVIESAAALVTVESGLWFIAAASGTPFVIVPWWLPRSVNWPGWMQVPHRLIYRDCASTGVVLSSLRELSVGAR